MADPAEAVIAPSLRLTDPHGRTVADGFDEAYGNVDDVVILTESVRTADGTIEDFRYAYLNPAGLRMMGRPAEEVIGRGLLEMFPSHVPLGYFAHYVAAVETGERREFEIPVFDENGVTGSFHLAVWRHGDGYIAIGRDITEQIERDQALLESEARYRLLAEQASDVVFRVTGEGIIDWISPSITEAAGWRPDDLVGRSALDLLHPDDTRPDLIRPANDRREGFEARLRTVDGSFLWMAITVKPILDEAGAVMSFVGSGRDVESARQAREELADREDRLRLMLENSTDIVFEIDEGHAYRWVSPSVRDVLGWDPAELVGLSGADLVHPDDYRRTVEDRERFEGGVAVLREFRLRCADGSYRWVAGTSRAVRSRDGTRRGRVVGVRDVQEEVLAREALVESEQRYRLLAENASDVVFRMTPDRVLEWISDSIRDVLGWEPAEIVGRSDEEFIHPEDHEIYHRLIAEAAPGDVIARDVRLRHADGGFRWVRVRTREASAGEGRPTAVVGGLVDISTRRAAQAELAFAATHDALTGLPNRRMLVEEIERALVADGAAGAITAVLMVGLDRFKVINDSLGHNVGDELIRAAARRVGSAVRSQDLVARHGGDEIVVLMPGLSTPGEARRLAERLVVESRLPMTAGDVEVFATTSVGVAISSWQHAAHETSASAAIDLIREADTAMYAAKAAGRDRVALFTEDLRRDLDDRLRTEYDLRHALERGELAVWFQPEIDLLDGSVRACEALLRWHHPDGRLRMAGEFIDIAEDTGLILQIGEWVVREACAASARWSRQDATGSLVVRVNLSALQLREPDLLRHVDEALRDTGADPRLLCFEITETHVLDDNTTAQANLRGIWHRGIEIAIDDFGTGWASLSYVQRYPVHVLKIDQSFVANMAVDEGDHRIVAGIIALADHLGVSVTAEGVETAAQEESLREMGCAGAQGFRYSAAIPADDLPAFVLAREQSDRRP